MGNPVRPLQTTPGPGPVPVPSRELPPPQPRVNRALNDRAERVGRMAGMAVLRVRELPRRVGVMRERFTVTRGRTSEDTSAAAAEWKQNARHKFYQARNRADYYGHEYPMQVIAGSAGLAFVIGFALRIWRSNSNAHS